MVWKVGEFPHIAAIPAEPFTQLSPFGFIAAKQRAFRITGRGGFGRECGSLNTGVSVQPLHRSADMSLDCVVRYQQSTSDRICVQTPSNQLEDFQLRPGQDPIPRASSGWWALAAGTQGTIDPSAKHHLTGSISVVAYRPEQVSCSE